MHETNRAVVAIAAEEEDEDLERHFGGRPQLAQELGRAWVGELMGLVRWSIQ